MHLKVHAKLALRAPNPKRYWFCYLPDLQANFSAGSPACAALVLRGGSDFALLQFTLQILTCWSL